MRAISSEDEDEYSMDEVIEYKKEEFNIEPEKIKKIIEAGRYSQTGSNAQDVSYVIVKDKLQEVGRLVLETLNGMADQMIADENTQEQFIVYAHM